MQTDEDSLMLSLSMLPLSLLVTSSMNVEPKYKVVAQDGMILLFDNADAASSLDTRACYNAVGSRDAYRKILKILRKGHSPRLVMETKKRFFGRVSWSSNVAGHYVYNGVPVQEFCERVDLIIIKSIRP